MKIETLSTDKRVPVSAIDPGQCFRIDGKTQVFMMIDSVSNNRLIYLEAVNIETGKRITLPDGRKLVTPVCVEATIFEEV